MTLRLLVPSALLLASAVPAQIVITQNTFIGSGDSSYDGQDLIVRGATLTVDGFHRFSSLRLERNATNIGATLTHSFAIQSGAVRGMYLVISGDFSVEGAEGDSVQSVVEVSSRGYGPGQGPGAGAIYSGNLSWGGTGGAHGGQGGAATTNSGYRATGPRPYGDPSAPDDFGSGGNILRRGGGAAGGGAVRIEAGGTITLDGTVRAIGVNAPGSNCESAGGGAGGSVRMQATTFSGSGLIQVHGGNSAGSGCNQAAGGGGSGGRIAITCQVFAFTGAMEAFGGTGALENGGAGTIFTRIAGQGHLVMDGGGRSGALTELEPTTDWPYSVSLRNGAQLSAPAATLVRLRVGGDLSIDANSRINGIGRGFQGSDGPGGGAAYSGNLSWAGTGGAHGGQGGAARVNTADRIGGPRPYGDITEPRTMGSGSGGGSPGGAAIEIEVAGQLTVDGMITVDGSAGGSGTCASYGGGAGGSLLIRATAVAGDGSIRANGGDSALPSCNAAAGGGGGGGRIAIYCDHFPYMGLIETRGGVGARENGGAGTRFTEIGGVRELTIDSGNQIGAVTELDVTTVWDYSVRLLRGTQLGMAAGGVVSVHVNGDLLIDSLSGINGSGRGYGPGEGPGAGGYITGNLSYAGSGGSHGGRGHTGLTNVQMNSATPYPYGFERTPRTPGSGGATRSGLLGSEGGGAIKLTVAGALDLQGVIQMNGTDGANDTCSSFGGGSGGSIWIVAEELLPRLGTVEAHGGNGGLPSCNNAQGGGGGGGRIAVEATRNQLPRIAFDVLAGSGGDQPELPICRAVCETDGTFYETSVIRPSLTGAPATLSVTAGESQQLALFAGSAMAGKDFLILGSLSGTQPGIPTSAGLLPLNSDLYFEVLARERGLPPVVGSPGTLDARGAAIVEWSLPPAVLSQVIGLRIDHAAVVGDLVTGELLGVSNSTPLFVGM